MRPSSARYSAGTYSGRGPGLLRRVVSAGSGTEPSGTYIRHPGEAQSWLASGAVQPETKVTGWLDDEVVKLAPDTLRRIGYLAGIYKALHIVYSDRELADSWVNRANAFLGGQTPMQRMLAGDVTDLAAVRAYVDAARAPWS